MKLQSLLTVAALTLSVMSQALVNPTQRMPRVKPHPITQVKDAMMGTYSSGALPEGFTDKRLGYSPTLHRNFLHYLSNLERTKKAQWKQYVMEDDGEFGDLPRKERLEKARDAYGSLGVRQLVEIEDVYSIYKDGKHIGYVFDTSDHVQAAIYQDGAGIVIYTDREMNVITTDEWSS